MLTHVPMMTRARVLRRPLHFVLALAAGLAVASCGGRTTSTHDGDSSATVTATAADSAAARHGDSLMSDKLPPLAPAPASLAADSLPLHAPDGGPVRYGIKSARIVQRFIGNQRGERTTTFDDYGMMERRDEEVKPFPERHRGAMHNVIVIVTPTEQAYADVLSKKGYRKPNESVARYLAQGASQKMSLGEMAMEQSGADRLKDTTIAGYHCRVYRKAFNGMEVTKWVWRGFILREHLVSPSDSVEYSVEPIEINANIDVPESTFVFGKDYKIDPYTQPAPKPKSAAPQPVEPKKQ